jgi:hypothetical protein
LPDVIGLCVVSSCAALGKVCLRRTHRPHHFDPPAGRSTQANHNGARPRRDRPQRFRLSHLCGNGWHCPYTGERAR